MTGCCSTVAVGLIFLCIQVVVLGQTLNRCVRSGTTTVVPPGTDRFIVTLEIFSGVPDPQWVITQDHPKYMDIKNELRSAKTYKQEQAPSKLGYQGFRVQEVTSGNKKPKVLLVGQETMKLQLLLLQTIPNRWITPTLYNIVMKEIQSGEVKPAAGATEAASKRFAAWYDPCKWNNGKHIELNNCYNYANDKRTDTFAEPGEGGGRPFPDLFSGEDLKLSAEADGLRFEKARKHMCPPNDPDRHLVAIFIYSGTDPSLPFDRDFHLYRLDNNGYWSHKPGQTAATDRDGKYDRIRDPRKADQGPIPYKFVCFMTTNRKTVNIS